MAEDERGKKGRGDEKKRKRSAKKRRGRKRVQQADTRVGTSDKLAQFWYNRVRGYNTPVQRVRSDTKRSLQNDIANFSIKYIVQ